MPSTITTPQAERRVTRTGFRKARLHMTPEAWASVQRLATQALEHDPTAGVLMTLRPSTYIGPGCDAERDGWLLSVSIATKPRSKFYLLTIYEGRSRARHLAGVAA